MPSETTIRDELAFERTLLAAERTLLAYLRTALALLAAGVGTAFLVAAPAAWWLGGTAIAVALATTAVGVRRFGSVRASLRRARAALAVVQAASAAPGAEERPRG